jgi:flagellar protein FlbD
MIRLTRLNHQEFVLNSDLIETIESNPDTVLTLSNSQKLVVLESADEIMDRVVAFRRRVLEGFGRLAV